MPTIKKRRMDLINREVMLILEAVFPVAHSARYIGNEVDFAQKVNRPTKTEVWRSLEYQVSEGHAKKIPDPKSTSDDLYLATSDGIDFAHRHYIGIDDA